MNFFKYKSILADKNVSNTNEKRKKRKEPLKLEKLWSQYLALDSRDKDNIVPLLKNIKRHQRKKFRNKRNTLYSSPFYNKDNDNNEVLIETTLKRTFNRPIVADDLSYVLPDAPDTETTSSNHLLFQCPVCLENDKLVDVILQCGHCLCRSCHEIMAKTASTYYDCPICRKNMTILDKEKGPTLHFV